MTRKYKVRCYDVTDNWRTHLTMSDDLNALSEEGFNPIRFWEGGSMSFKFQFVLLVRKVATKEDGS